MANSDDPYWILLLNDFLAEKDPSKLRERLETLEEAMLLRSQELKHTATGENERVALQIAGDRLLAIKIDKLGFPPPPGLKTTTQESC